MDRWSNSVTEIIAHERCSKYIQDLLADPKLSADDLFEIPRMRTYFNSGFSTASSDLRIEVSYVTALANVRSPIHAARIYCSIIKHLISKVSAYSADINVQDKIAHQGSVSDHYVTFNVIVNIRRGMNVQKLRDYNPEPVECAKTWRRIYGDRDPYKSTSVSTPSTTNSSVRSTSRLDRAFSQNYSSVARRLPDVKETDNLVAVYGSLRIGQHNHDLMRATNPNNRYKGKGTTAGELFPLGSTVPGAHFGAEYDGKVVVEVYSVDGSTMAGLDMLEGWNGSAATSNYVRKTVPVTLEDGNVVIAWSYEYPKRGAGPIIMSGDWSAYRRKLQNRG